MPQMSPMWWMSLMIYLNIMLMTTNSMMYFKVSPKNYKKMKINMKKMNWTW